MTHKPTQSWLSAHQTSFPHVSLRPFQQNIVFLQSNCCRNKQRKTPNLTQKWSWSARQLPTTPKFPAELRCRFWATFTAPPLTPCPARPHLHVQNNPSSSSQGSSPLLLPSSSLDKAMPSGRGERENRDLEPNIHCQGEPDLCDAVGKGKRELANKILGGFVPEYLFLCT